MANEDNLILWANHDQTGASLEVPYGDDPVALDAPHPTRAVTNQSSFDAELYLNSDGDGDPVVTVPPGQTHKFKNTQQVLSINFLEA